MKKVTNEYIADKIGKSEQTVRGWGVKFPDLYELVRVGALCKLNGLDSKEIEELLKIKESICKLCNDK